MGDSQLRLDFSNKFLIHYVEDSSWTLRILWTDEAHFTFTGSVNSKKCVHWTNNNPYVEFSSPLHDEKVSLWCGITSSFMLGTYCFEEVTDGGVQTCTVTSTRYHVN